MVGGTQVHGWRMGANWDESPQSCRPSELRPDQDPLSLRLGTKSWGERSQCGGHVLWPREPLEQWRMVRGGARGHCPPVTHAFANGNARRVVPLTARGQSQVGSHVTSCTTSCTARQIFGFRQNPRKSKIRHFAASPRAMAVQVSTSRLIVTFARRGLVTQARGPIRDSFVLGPAHRAHTSRHAIPVEEPAAHSVAPGVRLWSRSKKLWQVQEVPTHTANVESLVTVAQNLPNTSQPSRLARGRLSRAWSEATWSDVVHSK